MTDIQLCDRLLDAMAMTPPTASGTLTVSVVSGSTIQLTTDPGGAADAWVGCIIEVLTGNAAGSRAIVVESTGDIVRYATPFIGNLFPEPGDTVKMYGGPLAEARLYLIEPMGVAQDIEAGITYFVSVNCIKGQTEWKSFGGHSSRYSSETMRNQYSIEITMETQDRIGEDSGTDAKDAVMELPMLKEQILFICHKFKGQEANRISSDTPIKWTYGFTQRQGSPVMRCCLMTFNLNIL